MAVKSSKLTERLRRFKEQSRCVRKINVDTDNRLAITGTIRKAFADDPAQFDPTLFKPAREAMKEVVKARMISFGQAGQASKIQ